MQTDFYHELIHITPALNAYAFEDEYLFITHNDESRKDPFVARIDFMSERNQAINNNQNPNGRSSVSIDVHNQNFNDLTEDQRQELIELLTQLAYKPGRILKDPRQVQPLDQFGLADFLDILDELRANK